jgi:hypothetical protein
MNPAHIPPGLLALCRQVVMDDDEQRVWHRYDALVAEYGDALTAAAWQVACRQADLEAEASEAGG